MRMSAERCVVSTLVWLPSDAPPALEIATAQLALRLAMWQYQGCVTPSQFSQMLTTCQMDRM